MVCCQGSSLVLLEVIVVVGVSCFAVPSRPGMGRRRGRWRRALDGSQPSPSSSTMPSPALTQWCWWPARTSDSRPPVAVPASWCSAYRRRPPRLPGPVRDLRGPGLWSPSYARVGRAPPGGGQQPEAAVHPSARRAPAAARRRSGPGRQLGDGRLFRLTRAGARADDHALTFFRPRRAGPVRARQQRRRHRARAAQGARPHCQCSSASPHC